ncbi:hypothetical protein Dimus_003438, partial [Dionaea muscipula]
LVGFIEEVTTEYGEKLVAVQQPLAARASGHAWHPLPAPVSHEAAVGGTRRRLASWKGPLPAHFICWLHAWTAGHASEATTRKEGGCVDTAWVAAARCSRGRCSLLAAAVRCSYHKIQVREIM